MKILAIIPARAGSKGIPNKNIRILAGHPMIYYSLRNAIESNYITDVVVSTDSEHVRIISEQMGINVRWRSKDLSGDDVTLDSVIYDAIPDEKWDYIITLQPTSPTLSVETLDKAIKYTIENKLDTLISVINSPHLSWRDDNGIKVPNYIKRLNRQYLPPNYLETGAFVISKSEVVNNNTRIGNKVDIYEISKQEAIDIDNFCDMRNAELVLKKEKVAIYVNGNNKRGMGHIYRVLELADEFYSKPDIYYDINQTNPKLFGNTTHKIIGVNGISELFEICKKKNYTIFINDILDTSIDYMLSLKNNLPKDAKIINFEDDGEGIEKADLVINALYKKSYLNNVKAGSNYYIPGKTFMFYNPIEIKETVKNIFISFGGADPQNYTERLLGIITNKKYKEYNFIVVVGKAKKDVKNILKYNDYANIDVLYDVSNMPELMSRCDIGFTSRGRTGYELAILGIPSISMAQNNREEKHGFVSDENGFRYLGLNPTDKIIEDTLDIYINMSFSDRLFYQNKLLSHDLKNGRKRVINIINSL